MSWWLTCEGTDTAQLVDGPGFDYQGLVSVEGGDLLIKRRNDEDGEEQRIPIALLLRLLDSHGVKR